ncbi:glycosyltransferase family 2 protein [Winogradskyella sp. A2]|uniref:glycosyltransferase family 2 protein n=1 Tax=Winogradskyella sp. A2 TaxID=3366944 RepID=UPI00398C2EFB
MKYELTDIAIVILNWNGKDLLEKFLPSVVKFSENAKIYVADNASTDDSIQFLYEHYPEINVIKNKTNGGYAKGYNDALKHTNQPLLCLLNSDIEVTENWLSPILNQYNSDENVAIVQPKILDIHNKNYFEYAGAAGGFIDKYGYPYCRGRIFNTIEEDQGQYDDVETIFWASGACFFIKNSVFNELNGFDASYFAHYEEIDLCWRAFNNNYTTKYVGTSSVYHVGGATLQNTNPKKTYLNFRNSLFTLVKNTDSNVLSRTIIRMLLDGIAALRFLVQLKPRHFVAILKAHGSFYKHLGEIVARRNQLPKRANYYNLKSVVWSYFVNRQTKF